jgi:hypothetical protein
VKRYDLYVLGSILRIEIKHFKPSLFANFICLRLNWMYILPFKLSYRTFLNDLNHLQKFYHNRYISDISFVQMEWATVITLSRSWHKLKFQICQVSESPFTWWLTRERYYKNDFVAPPPKKKRCFSGRGTGTINRAALSQYLSLQHFPDRVNWSKEGHRLIGLKAWACISKTRLDCGVILRIDIWQKWRLTVCRGSVRNCRSHGF